MKEKIETIRTEIAKLKLEKDDKLIVRIRDIEDISSDAIESIGRAIKEFFPDNDVILIEGNIDIEKVSVKK